MDKKVTPMSIAAKAGSTPVCNEYDWTKQSVKYDVCKAGTMYSTGSMFQGSIEDWHQD